MSIYDRAQVLLLSVIMLMQKALSKILTGMIDQVSEGIETYFNVEMDMVQCQGATCKQRWFYYECIGKLQDWDPTNEDYYCAYCTRRK